VSAELYTFLKNIHKIHYQVPLQQMRIGNVVKTKLQLDKFENWPKFL